MSPIEGHTVWDHNKMWIGTYDEAYITINGSEVQGKGSLAHQSPWFSYDVYDTIKDYYLTFSVEGATQDDNHRGPFTNHRDYEWKFTGSVDKWDIHRLS
ncbi:hypothetical protein RhiirA5_423514 [Rhizophagus irregularis]|uniref:Uncharacterized protein n=1 Tax=Rhizophagus irregularis TaxID=588596 RepID=A0A2I1E7C1_9GLOM|nr:hypothetical protein RhiirA5_423514 [Rhizophagus irregularis]PKY17999.1 hypothetical protein RhiirB3_430722 [Rhizophagus irregularis]CAB5359069.1 unnamed protein product [Rhizophagus irregularis]